jgi:hypothetical protein
MRAIILFTLFSFFATVVFADTTCLRTYEVFDRQLGPVASELLDVFSMNIKEAQRSFDRLNMEDKQAVRVQIEKDLKLVIELTDAKLSIEETQVWVKKLIKYKIVFSETHIKAFADNFKSQFNLENASHSDYKTGLKSFERMMSSSRMEDREKIDVLIDKVVEQIVTVFTVKDWEKLSSTERDSAARRLAQAMDVNRSFEGLNTQVEEMQKFFNMTGSRQLLKTIVMRSLDEMIKIQIGTIPTWRTATVNGIIMAATAGGIYHLGIDGLGSMSDGFLWVVTKVVGVSTAITGSLMTTTHNVPFVKSTFERRRQLKQAIAKEKELSAGAVTEKAIETVREEIARDEQIEETSDFQFSIILNEIRQGLSADQVFKVSQWGEGFHRGFANVMERHTRLGIRLELIAKELDPVLTELQVGKPDAKRLRVFNRLVEITSPQLHNLLLDLNFLKSDYLALGIALDTYVSSLNQLLHDPALTDLQKSAVEKKLQRLNTARTNLLVSATRLVTVYTHFDSVVESVENYQDIISTDMALGL